METGHKSYALPDGGVEKTIDTPLERVYFTECAWPLLL